VTVQQKTTATGDYGSVEAWTTRYSGVPVRIQPMRANEIELYRRMGVEATAKAFVPDPADYAGLVESDRLQEGTTLYEIVHVKDVDLMEHHLELALRRVKAAL
jgi:hypothetical protein